MNTTSHSPPDPSRVPPARGSLAAVLPTAVGLKLVDKLRGLIHASSVARASWKFLPRRRRPSPKPIYLEVGPVGSSVKQLGQLLNLLDRLPHPLSFSQSKARGRRALPRSRISNRENYVHNCQRRSSITRLCTSHVAHVRPAFLEMPCCSRPPRLRNGTETSSKSAFMLGIRRP